MPDQPERQVHEPHDREPEHAEQHPGADRTGRGLARERGTLARVDPQRREQRDLRERPEDVQEAFEALRPGDETLRRTPPSHRRRRARDRSARQSAREGRRRRQAPPARGPPTAVFRELPRIPRAWITPQTAAAREGASAPPRAESSEPVPRTDTGRSAAGDTRPAERRSAGMPLPGCEGHPAFVP